MLLQINEPSQPAKSQSQSPAIGIDLGTTHSLAAIVKDDKPCLLTGLIPSVIGLIKNQIRVGNEVLSASHCNSIFSIKRLLGIPFDQLAEQQIKDYQFAKNSVQSVVPRLKLGAQELTPIELSAEILKEVKRQSEVALGQTVDQAVITVPAYFNDAQRQATKDAAQLAGLKVLRLLSEPTAAAVAYGLDQQAQGIYAIYDLGGGTFDFSILKFNQGVFQVIATGGDTQLGGDDFDLKLMQILNQLAFNADQDDKQVSRQQAKEIKHQLTNHESISFSHNNQDLVIERRQFNQGIESLIERTMTIIQSVLRDAKLSSQDIKGIVMVGGSTRVPLVQDKIQHFFNQSLLNNLNPDEIVACGAAIQAHALTQGSDTLLLDIVPLSLGVELMGGIVERIIERNTTIPACYSKTFTTQENGQTGLVLHIVQGEREKAIDCRSLAHFIFKGIPAMKAGQAKIKVTFQIDADGLLTVSAFEETTQKKQMVEVNATYGLNLNEMRRMLIESFDNAKVDLEERQLIETSIEGKNLIDAVIKACHEDGHLLESSHLAKIYQVIDQLESDIKMRLLTEIQCSIINLNTLTQDFADQRMSEAVKKLINGQSVQDAIESLHSSSKSR